MKTTNSFRVLFFLKKDKAHNGLAPLYVRITVNKKFVDISLKRRIKENSWNNRLQKISGIENDAKEIQEKIRQMRTEINSAYDDLRFCKEVVTAEAIKAKIEGMGEEEQITLLFLINYHNTEIAKLLEPGTMKNYYSTERYVKEFSNKRKKKADIYLSHLDYKFVIDFEIYLRQRAPVEKLKYADWQQPGDIKSTYNTADLLGKSSNRAVFDIGGNNYRMICKYVFGSKQIHLFVGWIGTHAEYDKICKQGDQHTVNLY